MPLVIKGDGKTLSLHPTTDWQKQALPDLATANLFNPVGIEYQYYLNCKEVH